MDIDFNQTTNKKYNLGIVLSGGGARGFAHIGVLKALNENGIYPDVISAVSAGSIVGSLYADGYAPDEIFNLFIKLDIFKLVKFQKPWFGLLRASGLQKTLQNELKATCFEELKIPMYVAATNFTKAKIDYFDAGPIIPAILASSAIPLILKPVLLNGDYYVDGGLMNNLPVEPICNNCTHIIGVNVNPVTVANKIQSLRNYADRVMHLGVRANIQNNIDKCTYFIEPPGLMEYNLFKVSAAEKIFEMGYNHTLSKLNDIKLALQ